MQCKCENSSVHQPFVQDRPCKCGHLWDLTIAKGRKPVHPSGHPISHSTHSGFSAPPLFAAYFPRSLKPSAIFTSSSSIFPPFPFTRLPGVPALGVGHIGGVASGFFGFLIWRGRTWSLRYSCEQFPVFFQSCAVGVRHNPYPLSFVRCSGMNRSEHSPFRIVPHRGQVPENLSKSPRSEYWAVLHKRVSRSYFANDPRHVLPHSAAFPCDARSLSGAADVLARKASRYHVNKAAPRSSVKGLNVIPNRERREKALILSGGKYSSGVGFPFDCTDGFPSKQFSAKDAATGPREESQFSKSLLLICHAI